METFYAKSLLSPQGLVNNVKVVVDEGVICQLTQVSSVPAESYPMVVPGLVDVQINGACGILIDEHLTLDGLHTIVKYQQTQGTLSILPTVITNSVAAMQHVADLVARYRRQDPWSVLGVHFEGPVLNEQKKGIHAADKMQMLTPELIQLYSRSDLGKVMVTLAPEQVPCAAIEHLQQLGVIISLGHSNASYTDAQAAFQYGASGVTHLFNAMSPLTSREPGLVGACFNQRSFAGIIADGHHVHPDNIQLAYRLLGSTRLCLVSDAMPLVGSEQNQMTYLDDTILRRNGRLTTSNGTLAGSCLTLLQAVHNTQHYLFAFDQARANQAWYMASQTPAQWLGLNEVGHLQVGSQWRAIALDENGQLVTSIGL